MHARGALQRRVPGMGSRLQAVALRRLVLGRKYRNRFSNSDNKNLEKREPRAIQQLQQ